jgi:hypothetical protein
MNYRLTKNESKLSAAYFLNVLSTIVTLIKQVGYTPVNKAPVNPVFVKAARLRADALVQGDISCQYPALSLPCLAAHLHLLLAPPASLRDS